MNTFKEKWYDVHMPAEALARIDEQKAEVIKVLGDRESQN